MLKDTNSYHALTQHLKDIQRTNLTDLFSSDAERGRKFSGTTDGLFVDYSKQLITDKTLDLLVALADELKLKSAIDDMFDGKPINTTENRPVLHTALRNVSNQPIMLDGHDIMTDINSVLEHMNQFAQQIRGQSWLGYSGKPIKNIVNIGIGGSSLGPEMAFKALEFYSDRQLGFYFITNADPADFYETVSLLNPEETLFIISSKTFTTMETMTNAELAKRWIVDTAQEDSAISRHFVAVSTNRDAVTEFGINSDNMFEFWDWVGGRYSLMGAIGLSVLIAIGYDNFEQLRAGAYSIDRHFCQTDIAKNIPALLGLIDIWNRNFIGINSEAILPYSQYLRRLPGYLQQASMESNGKSVTKSGEPVDYQTASILWGESGTNGQHSFHQLLHQGTEKIAADFIGFKHSLHGEKQSQIKLNANLIAQAEALAFGQSQSTLTDKGVAKDLMPHKQVPGNKPSIAIVAEKLTPFSLGQIIALYEHRIFTQGHIWGINSFDQYGVELGKDLAQQIISGNQTHSQQQDSSTKQLGERLL